MKRMFLLFYMKKSKKLSNGKAPLYVRITIDEKGIEIACKRYIDPEKWNPNAQKMDGNSEDSRTLNAYLKLIEQDICNAHQQMIQEGKSVSTVTLKNKLTGKKEPFQSLVTIFTDHNDRVAKLVNQEYAPGTLDRYQTTLKHTISFMLWKYHISDIDIKQINHEFITSFESYLRSVRKSNNNSAVKYIKNFKKIIRICIANGWLIKDPFINYKSKVKEVKRDFLTEEELQLLTRKVFSCERLNQIRDILFKY